MKCQECKYCRSIGEGFTNFSTFEHYGENVDYVCDYFHKFLYREELEKDNCEVSE